MTHKGPGHDRDAACSNPAANCWCWNFPKVAKPLEKAYDWYSFKRHCPSWAAWSRATTKATATWPSPFPHAPGAGKTQILMQKSGFGHVDYHNMCDGG